MSEVLNELCIIFTILLVVAGIAVTLIAILVCVVTTIAIIALVAYILVQGSRDWIRMSRIRREMAKQEEEKWKNEKDARITQLHAPKPQGPVQ